jgi:7-cyano-7-deazaguanine synthase
MSTQDTAGPVGVLLSGGLDSSILLADLLARGRIVQPFYVRSQLVWERYELDAARRFTQAVRSQRLRELVVLDVPVVDLYEQHWSVTGENTPDARSSDEAVFLPGRNALLVIKAAVWCQLHGVSELALASLGTSPFADASDTFFEHLAAALNCGAAGSLRILRPFARMTKRQVMTIGKTYPLELTFSCLSPRDGYHCGNCNKCAERQAAFRDVGLPDCTTYCQTTRSSSPLDHVAAARNP